MHVLIRVSLENLSNTLLVAPTKTTGSDILAPARKKPN